jgi:hypothetical protein
MKNKEIKNMEIKSFNFWFAAAGVIGPISLIFYFPFSFVVNLLSSPLGLSPKIVGITPWVLSVSFGFAAILAGWKVFKADK